MSYCVNPACPNPENPPTNDVCAACGTTLLLRDRYRVNQALGQGGFGATFLARDESLPGQPYCVIKQLRPASTTPQVLQMARELFRREAKTLGKIGNHPQLPRLLDYFETEQEFYLVQEYISGSTLHREVKRGGPFTEAGVKQFLSELLPLVEYIHSQQVIHRDIKPANLIRRNQDKKLVLIDFGAVKDQVNPTVASASEQTALTAYAIGTPGYAPPEQMALRPVYASDIYAVGVTCVYLLTAKSPKDLDYDPTTGELMWQNHVQVSEHFANVLKKMLEVSVRHRYQSAGDILRALDLEPYLDSLAQGMIAQTAPISGGQPQSFVSPNRVPQGPTGLTQSARMAEMIKNRQKRLNGTLADPRRSTISSSNTSSFTSSNTQATTGGKARVPTRLNSDDLLTYYGKGRRDFADHDLSALNLQQANLADAIFTQSKFVKTDFRGANLYRANFGRARLKQTILRDANLSRAYFNYANLEGADLRGADLSYAHLSNANLRSANLCGANLTGAKVTEEQLAVARINWATILPSGKRGFW
ncbi:pentapeptide repeat-containing protein [Desertifilum sp. FACHB-1129]|uniref:Serine/threonine-protein kinase B n=1 Tax=Desertifilum tharense IPPAS B-1220 TaxID=1781255 RepID=A0A1E5QNT0_9CYAN|nr:MULTISPECIES: serine/threonine-protein kinase [Desertifilum]MCD8487656.1 serine/threonine-protein kinase [Desertifilum sp.]MDA0209368.1 serine/threonine-protein kinase [Cyanobacteria bacterium FC1]MBD2311642.1 pentapeptide repeat-containing protein [Desertifilum sp. FACHB-1129]MBD2322833.1 pentapeptide repeat-containing protein [Desertifilum sp. FACHB-866]MBD2332773.1 pentapeptide repeat-containing protein [Desertifilum sp. FACHB-868]